MMTLRELCKKDVIQKQTGTNIGRVDDLRFAPETAEIAELILFGRLRLFGLLGREDDFVVPWPDIESIGEDVIVVCTEPLPAAPRRLFGR